GLGKAQPLTLVTELVTLVLQARLRTLQPARHIAAAELAALLTHVATVTRHPPTGTTDRLPPTCCRTWAIKKVVCERRSPADPHRGRSLRNPSTRHPLIRLRRIFPTTLSEGRLPGTITKSVSE